MTSNGKATARLSALSRQIPLEHYDVAVVGLGALGSAAAYHAGKKGAKVIALEQFELGHVRGASHDTSRIVRTSYELPEYVALARSAYNDWAELESTSKQKLLTITGGVVILPQKNGMPAPDRWTNGIPTASDWTRNLDANNEEYELLNNTEANARWPVFNLNKDLAVIYSKNTGIVHAYKSITAMQFMARVYGVDMRERTKVESVTPSGSDGSRLILKTSSGSFSASKVVLATDAWTNELLKPFGVHIPVRITQEQVTYFKPSQPEEYEADKLPVWVWVGPQWYYGFPCYGEPTIKAGHDNAQQYMTPAERTFVPSEAKVEELAAHLQSFIPDQTRQVLRTVTCQYTMTQDRQFVISELPSNKNVIVTLGAAHGFKYALSIGRVAAELAIDGGTKEDISKFRIETVSKSVRHTGVSAKDEDLPHNQLAV